LFEDRTYENIMAECLATAPEGIDLRQGGIFYDAVTSACLKIAQFYADISSAFDLAFLTSAADEYLDRKGAEYRVFRLPATAARYGYLWTGTAEPGPGERFFADGLYFTLRRGESQAPCLEAETPGSAGNSVLPGTAAVPMNNIGGLSSSSFGALAEPGMDAESDDDYRERIQEKIAGPAENGNRQHYKTWCESVPGCARARIIPLFAGENTVMGVIVGVDGTAAAQSVVDRVQEFVDPITLGGSVVVGGETIPIGDGLGDGEANIGAHFAAVAPEQVTVDASFSAELKADATLGQVKADAEAALVAHFKGLALTTPENQAAVVRVSAVSSLLHALPGLLDHTGLALNGESSNIGLTGRQVAVLGEVAVNEAV
jgi:uncharacterized phage protein gp47/JayE